MPYSLAVGLAKEVLKHGGYYFGSCGEASIARWNAMTNRFTYLRSDSGHKVVQEICHPDDNLGLEVFIAEKECSAECEIPLKDI